VLYTDADLSAHLGHVGFAVHQIVNTGFDVSIGSRKLDVSSTAGANTKGGKLWCYLWSNMFPGLELTDTQVGFKAFRARVLRQMLNRPMIEHGLTFDVELLLVANTIAQRRIGEFPLLWIHSLAESKIKQSQQRNFLEMVQALGRLYNHYGQRSERGDSFAQLVSTISLDELDAMLDSCPLEIYSQPYVLLRHYQAFGAPELLDRARRHLSSVEPD
jgi:hypothetical protein